ncbi:hypothetical protein J7I98_39815 [Streptomyces sp. ISL-98]|uniref:hypothetical protein n=1 Tax=Streptomyces sp. ISL-98 TaxID=2819192 RepID=UPI001BEC250D|nr:hypothetical protein [Streptomyces sp. ISL-98]MBT2511807.1 hypothetical protein [Streptomyces sp. ISL-98]
MSTSQSRSTADVQVDEEGRVVIQSPELAAHLRDIQGNGMDPLARSVINVCPNLVAGCGSPPM